MIVAGQFHLAGSRPLHQRREVGGADGAMPAISLSASLAIPARCNDRGAEKGRSHLRDSMLLRSFTRRWGTYSLIFGWGILVAAFGGPAFAEQADATASTPAIELTEAPPAPTGLAIIPEALAVLLSNYIAPLNEEELANQTLKQLIGSLDGHSNYLTRQEYTDLDQNLTGEFGGIGVVLEVVNNTARVIAPVDGGASASLGVQPGWEIVRVDGVDIRGRVLNEIVRLLRGQIGTTVVVTFFDQTKKEHVFAIERKLVRLDSVYARQIGDAGYIRISSFTRTTPDELGRAIGQLQAETTVRGLILDLRNNTGGFVDSAVAVAAHFLGSGQPAVRTGRDASSANLTVTGAAIPMLTDVPIVVLVNGGTASASEILAGALRDNNRARLLGVTTYGKGLVQTIFPLNGGANGAVSVTTMRYYTPSGRSIQQVGLEPDVAVARTKEEAVFATQNSGASEATLVNALANETLAVRKALEEVEGPEFDLPANVLFASPSPSDADIAADHQILRAMDLLNIERPEWASGHGISQVFRRAEAVPALSVDTPQ